MFSSISTSDFFFISMVAISGIAAFVTLLPSFVKNVIMDPDNKPMATRNK